MKSKFLTISFCLFVLTTLVFPQDESEQLDAFGEINCEETLARSDNLLNELNNNPTAIAYIVFYEGKHAQYFYNKKTKKPDSKLVNPRRGEARNKAQAIILYLTKWRELPKEKLVLINGGYRESYGVEFWIARKGVGQPKPTPTLEEKSIKFRKGKLPKFVDCTSLN